MQRLAFFGLLFSVACTTTTDDEEAVWELVWEDEFRGEAGAPPDPDNWVFDIGTGDNGWGNNELQYYTDRPENIQQTGDGFLRVTAITEDFEGSAYTSARIKTQGLREYEYGRIRARIRTPVERAIWPAFWMLGADLPENPWPLAGEIDIMEVFGVRAVGSAIHGPGYSGGQNINFPYLLGEDNVAGFDADFHEYEVLWDPQQIVWIIDGTITGVATPADLPGGAAWVFDHEFFFLLNLAVGGNPVQAPDATTPQTASMDVDFIKVYERVNPLIDPNAPTEE
ncbi:MAG: glycoside hydrolase family 16 protein [Myxococcota bacterium]